MRNVSEHTTVFNIVDSSSLKNEHTSEAEKAALYAPSAKMETNHRTAAVRILGVIMAVILIAASAGTHFRMIKIIEEKEAVSAELVRLEEQQKALEELYCMKTGTMPEFIEYDRPHAEVLSASVAATTPLLGLLSVILR